MAGRAKLGEGGVSVSDTHHMREKTEGRDRLTTKQEAVSQAEKIKPELAALLDGGNLDELSEPEFRVLSLMGERKGIRLEAVFWRALEQIARDLHIPRNTLVLWIMSAAGEDRHNATSVLRSALIAYLLDELERLQTSTDDA